MKPFRPGPERLDKAVLAEMTGVVKMLVG